MGFGRSHKKLICAALGCLLTLTALTLAGCRTYFGYDDIEESDETPLPDGEPRDVRHYAVLSTQNGKAELKCFRRYTLPKNTLRESRITGRREFYSDYEADYYFKNSPYNAGWNKKAWLFSVCYFFLTDEKGLDGNPLLYLLPIAGQIVLAWDLGAFLTCSLVDGCLFIGRCCWTGVSIPCAWFWGRTFGWMGDWQLREHKPGPLRMLGYMPLINYFIFQTPPYMAEGGRYSEKIKYDSEDQTILTRTRVVKLVPQQEMCSRYEVGARVLCNGRNVGSRKFRTNYSGEADLTEFLRECVKAAPLAERDFSLELELSDGSGEQLKRKVKFKAEHVMSPRAANDLAACRGSDTDYLNKLLLRRRSHVEWREEVFSGDFKLPQR